MSTFTVMTWNVENLFRANTNGGPTTTAAYEQKLVSLAGTIVRLAPDVLALQEVGDPDALADLLALLPGRYPHTALSNHPDGRGIRVGFLSTLPIMETEQIVDFPSAGLSSVPGIDGQGHAVDVTAFSRGVLRVRVQPHADLAVDVITAHFKSKLLTFPAPAGRTRFAPRDENERARVAGWALLKRTAEAVALRVHANDLLHDDQRALIVLGDLNDVVDAATTEMLQGPGGSEIGTVGFDRPDQGDAARLFNLAPLITPERRYSRIYKTNKELIDHIFVSQSMLPGQPRALPVVDSHVDLLGGLPSVADDPTLRRGKPGSDHAPVTATFTL